MTVCSHQCLMTTPDTGLLPACAETGSCCCTKKQTNNKLRDLSHFQKEISRLIYTTRIFGLWRKLRVCATFILMYKWNPYAKTLHRLWLTGGASRASSCDLLCEFYSIQICHPHWLCSGVLHAVHQILIWQETAVYTEWSVFWLAGIHRNNIS